MLTNPAIPGKTINELLQYWASTPKRNTPAFVSFSADGRKQCLNRKEVYKLASAFAYKLSHHGVRKGDIVCVALPNSLERIVCDMGVLLAGATSMNGQVLLADGQDFLLSIKSAKAKFVITDPSLKKGAWSFLKDKTENANSCHIRHPSLPDLRQVIKCERDNHDSTRDFLSELRMSNDSLNVTVSPSDQATIMTTSGSTGYSKLVPFTHANLCHFCLQVRVIEPFDEGDRFINCAPLGWAGGYPQWYLGSGVIRYFLDLYDGPPTDMPRFVWNIITSEKILYGFMSPVNATAILNDPSLWNNKDWKPKVLCLAGQPVNHGHLDIIGKLCEAVDINYGMTECNLVSTHRIEDPSSFVDGCAGFPGYGVQIKIVDKDKEEVPKGTVGEILLQSPALTSGYLNNDAANEAAFTSDGWLCTNDAGYFDPQTGKIQVEGRQSDSIMRGAYILYPGWLEQIIRKVDRVKDVVIVPVPDKVLHNEICACVVTDIPYNGVTAGSAKLEDANEFTSATDPLLFNSKPHSSSYADKRQKESCLDTTDRAEVLNYSKIGTEFSSSVFLNGSMKHQNDLEDIRKSGMKKPLSVPYNQTLIKSDCRKIEDSTSQLQDRLIPTENDQQQHLPSMLKLEQEIRQHCKESQVLHANDSMRMEPRYYVFFDKFALTNTGKISRKEVRSLALMALTKDRD